MISITAPGYSMDGKNYLIGIPARIKILTPNLPLTPKVFTKKAWSLTNLRLLKIQVAVYQTIALIKLSEGAW